MRTMISIVIVIAHFSSKLTGGYSTRYQQFNLKESTKNRLALLQGLLALILAFGITNNYLIELPLFNRLFASSNFWIIGIALLLLVILLIAIGSLITFLVRKWKPPMANE